MVVYWRVSNEIVEFEQRAEKENVTPADYSVEVRGIPEDANDEVKETAGGVSPSLAVFVNVIRKNRLDRVCACVCALFCLLFFGKETLWYRFDISSPLSQHSSEKPTEMDHVFRPELAGATYCLVLLSKLKRKNGWECVETLSVVCCFTLRCGLPSTIAHSGSEVIGDTSRDAADSEKFLRA